MNPESEEPLDASWIIAFDEEGNDLALAAQLAAMTPEQRAHLRRSPELTRVCS
jgi:hypothetical protein